MDPSAVSSPDSKDRPFRILVVDDVPDNVDLLSEHLEDEGYEVLTANDGPQALEVWAARAPDLMLLDIMMPGMSGFDVCRHVRARQKPGEYMPILLVTALQDTRSKTEGLEAGAEDFISKPFEAKELLARVRAHLRAKMLHDRLARANAALEHERDLIAQIQMSLLPEELPNTERLRVAARYLPSDKAGGDYYDVFPVADDLWAFTVADVSGHGTPAAVVMAVVKSLLHVGAVGERDPSAILRRLDAELLRHIKTGDFVTMSYALIDLKTREMRYASAGHHPPLLCRPGAAEAIGLANTSGFPLVIDPNNPIGTASTLLAPGDRVLFFTDGIIEARNPRNEMYEVERLTAAAHQTAARTPDPDAWADAILADLNQFLEGMPLNDDYTMLCIEVR